MISYYLIVTVIFIDLVYSWKEKKATLKLVRSSFFFFFSFYWPLIIFSSSTHIDIHLYHFIELYFNIKIYVAIIHFFLFSFLPFFISSQSYPTTKIFQNWKTFIFTNILFYSILFYFDNTWLLSSQTFYSILFYSTLTILDFYLHKHSILFYSILLWRYLTSIFTNILFYSILLWRYLTSIFTNILFYSILFFFSFFFFLLSCSSVPPSDYSHILYPYIFSFTLEDW